MYACMTFILGIVLFALTAYICHLYRAVEQCDTEVVPTSNVVSVPLSMYQVTDINFVSPAEYDTDGNVKYLHKVPEYLRRNGHVSDFQFHATSDTDKGTFNIAPVIKGFVEPKTLLYLRNLTKLKSDIAIR